MKKKGQGSIEVGNGGAPLFITPPRFLPLHPSWQLVPNQLSLHRFDHKNLANKSIAKNWWRGEQVTKISFP
jgi:hypothetical protein